MDSTIMGIGMWIFWIVIILIVVLVIKLLVNTGGMNTGSSSETPMDILKKRYAKGEIDTEEFEKRMKELGK